MKKIVTISVLALTVASLGAIAGQAQDASGASGESRQVQTASWRGGDEGGWREGRHGRDGGHRFWREGRHGGGHGRGGDMMRRLQEFDLDKDGSITQAEIDQVRQGQVAQFDANKDGTLSLEEYQALWLDRMRERMVDAFQEHDDDGNGQVTPEEFNERFSALVERLDRNGDGQLNADDRRGNRRHDRQTPVQPGEDTAPNAAPDAPPAPAPQP